jgi:hypothetical protein
VTARALALSAFTAGQIVIKPTEQGDQLNVIRKLLNAPIKLWLRCLLNLPQPS